MKIGTDAVLLGSWVKMEQARSILDIGTGCGILALMMAQRSEAIIDAVEIDRESALEAGKNFQKSPWKDRINLYLKSFQEFAEHNHRKYDLVISNPPFFSDSLRSPDRRKSISRHDDLLPLEILLSLSEQLLEPSGRAVFIFPADSLPVWIDLALRLQLYPFRKCIVFSREGKQPSRVMMEFSMRDFGIPMQENIRICDTFGNYTVEYKELTNAFYLGLP